MESPRRHDKSVSPDADVRRRSRPLPGHHDDSGAPTGLRRRSRHYGDNSEAAAVIEQEMENVQALKRLSIGAVSALDPDLPSFNPLYDDTAVASPHSRPRSPDGGYSSGPGINASQASELLWVPAAVHPELAPNQWKEFVQHKVAEIKESVSRSPSPTSPMGPGGSSASSDNDGSISPSSSSSLSRRNSRLSRVISRQEEYMDGSDVLEQQRQRRQSNESLQSIASLSQHLMSLGDLESLAADPFQLRRKLSDSQGKPAAEPLANDSDEPILSTPSSSLRRSTRTRYNKNSLRRPRRGSGRASPLPAREESASTEQPTDQSLVDSIPVRKLSLSDSSAPAPAPAIAPAPAPARAPARAPSPAPALAATPAPASAPVPASAPALASGLEPELQSHPADETVRRRPSQGLGLSANRTQPAIEEEVKPLSVPKRPVLHREKSDSQLREKTDHQLQRSQTFDGTESAHQPAPPRRTKTTIEEDVSDALAHTRSSNLANPSKLSESTDVLSSIPLADSAEQPPSRPEPEPESPVAGSGKRKPSWRWLFNSNSSSNNSNSNGNASNQNDSPPVGGTIVDKKSIDKLLNRTEDDAGDAIGVQEPEKKPAKKSGGFSSLFSKKKSKKDVEQDKPAMTTMATSIQSALEQKRNKSPERHGGPQPHKASRPKSHHARKRSHPKNKLKAQTATSYAMQQHKRRSQQQMERQQAALQDGADGRGAAAGAGRDVRLPYNIPAHQMSDKSMVMMYHRYPLHIERAIYRLSHLKLANPRRPLAQQVLLSNFMYAYLNLINHGYQQEQQALYEQQLRAKHEQGDAVSTAEQYAAYGYAADGSAEPGYEYGYEYDYGAGYGDYEAYDEYGVYEQYEDGPYTGAEEGEPAIPAKSPDSTSSSSSSSAGGDDYWTGDDDEQAFTADASSVGEASTVSSKSASGPGPGPGPGPVSGPSSSSGSGSHIGHRRNFHDSSAYVHAEPVTQP